MAEESERTRAFLEEFQALYPKLHELGMDRVKAADIAFSVVMSGLSPAHSPEVREYYENAKLSLGVQREALALLQEFRGLAGEDRTQPEA